MSTNLLLSKDSGRQAFAAREVEISIFRAMKIKATKVNGEDLKAGDLFSTANQLYWDYYKDNESIGEKVYIRTEKSCPKGQEKEKVFKIEILMHKE